MKHGINIWRYFLDSTPTYLARHYWWAYLWRPAIWFFDHQPIINAILFGQYRRLMQHTLTYLDQCPRERMLQLTCVYGKLTPSLIAALPHQTLYLVDVATAQLEASRNKLSAVDRQRLLLARMNAECLGFADNSFTTVLVFFLMHEMPPQARHNTLHETLRVLAPGGRLVITEYGAKPHAHWLYRFWPLRKLITYWEPFLDGFWNEDLTDLLQTHAADVNKTLTLVSEQSIFSGFYRVLMYQVGD